MSAKAASAAGARAHRRTRSRWRPQAAHLFVLPYVFFLLIFGVGPGLYALVISFADFRDGTPHLFEAGLQNYVTAFTDFRFLPAFRNVLTFLLVSLPFGVIGVVALALLLHARGGWFASAMRTLYFVPGAVAGPTAVVLAIFMFDPNVSPFRILLHGMGYQNVIEVITPAHLPWIFTLIGFFAGAGGWIAIFYGALNNISQEVLEAATIDGCSAWQLAMHIKRPLISSYIIYMLILTFAGNVQLFAEPQLISASGAAPIDPTWSPNQLGYTFAFGLGNFGASAAISLVMVLIGLLGAILVIVATDFYRTSAD